jgi:hypothetical protein
LEHLENVGSITNIDRETSLLDMQYEVLFLFIEDAKEEIIAFKEGYGFEEPYRDDFEDEMEYLEELDNYNDKLNGVAYLIQSSYLNI